MPGLEEKISQNLAFSIKVNGNEENNGDARSIEHAYFHLLSKMELMCKINEKKLSKWKSSRKKALKKVKLSTRPTMS